MNYSRHTTYNIHSTKFHWVKNCFRAQKYSISGSLSLNQTHKLFQAHHSDVLNFHGRIAFQSDELFQARINIPFGYRFSKRWITPGTPHIIFMPESTKNCFRAQKYSFSEIVFQSDELLQAHHSDVFPRQDRFSTRWIVSQAQKYSIGLSFFKRRKFYTMNCFRAQKIFFHFRIVFHEFNQKSPKNQKKAQTKDARKTHERHTKDTRKTHERHTIDKRLHFTQ